MLKRDDAAEWTSEKGFLAPLRFRFEAKDGGRVWWTRDVTGDEWDEMFMRQLEEPVWLLEVGRRNWWWYREEFWVEDEGLGADDLQVLVEAKAIRQQRRLSRARAVVEQGLSPRGRREAIPDNVKVLVWQRDGGRCVNCGSNEDLEFDHIIPLALGGANTLRNLQLLRGTCNRAKGGSLT